MGKLSCRSGTVQKFEPTLPLQMGYLFPRMNLQCGLPQQLREPTQSLWITGLLLKSGELFQGSTSRKTAPLPSPHSPDASTQQE